jgi:peroxiredoxin/tetratricopeptide (TPR) repeat protein
MTTRKSNFLLVLIIACFTADAIAGNKNFSFAPQKPTPGAAITITYNPQFTVLEKSAWVKAFVTEYSKSADLTEEYNLIKKGNVWEGSFTTSDTTNGVAIRFKGEEGTDNNEKKMYIIHLFDKKGNYMQGTFGGLASGYASWFTAFEMDPDYNTAYNLFKKEYEQFPSSKKDFINPYLFVIRNVDKNNAAEITAKEIEEFAKSNSGSDDDMWQLLSLYRSNRMMDKAAALESEYKQKYPNGKFIPVLKFSEYRLLKSLAEKQDYLKKFEEAFPDNQYVGLIYNDIISALIKENNMSRAIELLNSYKNAPSMFYNNIAWNLYETGSDLKTAEDIVTKGITLAKEGITNPKGKRPQLYSTIEWENARKRSAAMILDTYGAILLKQNKFIDAEKVLAEAVQLNLKEEPEINERYAESLLANKKYDLARKELEEFFTKGANTSKMKDMFKESFIKTGGTESGFESYFKKFEDAATEKIITKLKKEIMNEPAPQFTLVDLLGKNVSLSDYKGKVVIVDFWATWCGPCLDSFPAMKEAVEKYESTGKAKFLFLNTWENVEDKLKNASDFIKKNNYPFHVLMDDKNQVVSAFKVSGIPTKFIIDGNGNIRFKSVGFSGNTSEVVEEIGIMIKMIQ